MNRHRKKYGHRYPWVYWFSYPAFTLRRWVDYEVLTHGMMNNVRKRARALGVRVSIRIPSANVIEVTVIGPVNGKGRTSGAQGKR